MARVRESRPCSEPASVFHLAARLEDLASCLACELERLSAARDPFAPVLVVVPNRNLKKWLQLYLARRFGVAINLRFEYLETGLWELLRGLSPEADAPELLDAARVRLLVLAVLLDERTPAPEFQEYLAPGGTRGPDYYRRAWQLAGELARCFRDYEYHRPEMVREWLAGRDGAPARDAETQRLVRAQRALFRMALGGLAAKWEQASGKRWRTLPQWCGDVLKQPCPAAQLPAHLFGLAQLSPFHSKLIVDLAQHYQLHVYHLNPLAARQGGAPATGQAACQAFGKLLTATEATPAASPRRAARKLEPGLFEASADDTAAQKDNSSELLALWGFAGREGIRLLVERWAAKKDLGFEVRPATAASGPRSTVLARLQEELLTGAAPGGAKTVPPDRSLQVVACPGLYREVETVYQSIVRNLKEDANLQLTDVAVLVTDMELYRPALQAAFGRRPQLLPFNLTDFRASGHSAFGQAIQALFDLAQSTFSRSHVFNLLLNPCCLAAAGVTREQALAWVEWAEALHVHHSWDAADRGARGAAGSPLYTWRLGLQRMRLGRLMDPPEAGDAARTEGFRGVLPFPALGSADRELLGPLSVMLESLLPRLRELRDLSATCSQWRERLRPLVLQCLAVPEERPEEAPVRESVLEALDALASFDALRAAQGQSGGVGLPLVREFVLEQLADLDSTVGDYLTGGVTLSALQPVRPIPFQIIYLLGLGENAFPGSPIPSGLDLRALEPRPGDISPPQTNRYLFLETLLAARRKVYLSYLCRDVQKDQELFPSSVITQLMRFVGPRVSGEFAAIQMPLHGASPAYLKPDDPAADVRVNYSPSDRLLCLLNPAVKGAFTLTKRHQEQIAAQMEKSRCDFRPPAGERPALPETETVTLRELRKFLENPAEAALKRHLRLFEEDEQDRRADEEPFFSVFPEDYQLAAEALRRFVTRGAQEGVQAARREWEEKFRLEYAARRLESRLPDGAFAERDRQRLVEDLRKRLGNEGALPEQSLTAWIESRRSEGGEFHEAVALGEAQAEGAVPLRFPAAVLPLAGGPPRPTARLSGLLPLVWRTKTHVETLVLSGRKKVDADALNSHLFDPVLFYLAALLAPAAETGDTLHEWWGPRGLQVHVAHKSGVTAFTYQVTQDEALEYLASLVTDFLDRDTFDLLPFAVMSHNSELKKALPPAEDAGTPGEFASLLREALDAADESAVPGYRPTELLALLDAQVPEDACAKVRRRFALFAHGLEKKEPRRKGARA